jgi:hypothetical protein
MVPVPPLPASWMMSCGWWLVVMLSLLSKVTKLLPLATAMATPLLTRVPETQAWAARVTSMETKLPTLALPMLTGLPPVAETPRPGALRWVSADSCQARLRS